MPGSRLSKAEESLISMWKFKTAHNLPRLSSISITSEGNGLRGIKNLFVDLDHPIIVLCGQHGSGKSTILALCRLAFAQTIQFDDLFIEINQQLPFDDFSATWMYRNFETETISFDARNRNYSSIRPTKSVHYIGLSRIVPAWEKKPLVQHYRQSQVMDESKSLDAKHLMRLRDTLNKNYIDAGIGSSAGYEIRTCSTGQSYTSFNMCTGEEILVEMYRLLQNAAPESLILIEDAEVGLNPVVIPKFAKNMIDICLEKRLQIILTTHSLDLISSFPSEFISLIKSDNVMHESKHNPPLQEVLTSISSQIEQDIIIFCEDEVAESLIKQAAPGDMRPRLKIVHGSKTKLLGYAESHIRAGWSQIPIVIWDGDVTSKEVDDWLTSLGSEMKTELISRVSLLKLPGSEPPEKWILSQLSTDDGCSGLSQELDQDKMTTRSFIVMLTTMSEFHSLPYELAQKIGWDKATTLSTLVRTISRLPNHPLESLRRQLERAANKEIVSEIKFTEHR